MNKNNNILNETDISFGENNFYKITVYGNEGVHQPHFHITIGNQQSPVCKVRLDECKYEHNLKSDNDKNKQYFELQRKTCMFLNEVLMKPYKDDKTISNWEFLKNKWNEKNGKYHRVETEKQPDYTKLYRFNALKNRKFVE